jgi:IS6 family transposase
MWLSPCSAPGDRWFVNETDVKVSGRWTYLYRAVDEYGQVIEVLLSRRRDLAAARRIFRRALRAGVTPAEVTTGRAPAYPRVLDELIPSALHVTERYANNRVEADHGRLKARLRPVRGLKQHRSARIPATGHVLVQNIRRGHYELAPTSPTATGLAWPSTSSRQPSERPTTSVIAPCHTYLSANATRPAAPSRASGRPRNSQALAAAGIRAVKIPPGSPRERYCGKVRAHRPDRGHRQMLIFGQRHLRAILAQYQAHYNGRRPTAASSCARPGPITPSPVSTGSGSSVGPSSAVSSTSTSEPGRSPVQVRWPSTEPRKLRRASDAVFQAAGARVIRSAIRAPRMNSITER